MFSTNQKTILREYNIEFVDTNERLTDNPLFVIY